MEEENTIEIDVVMNDPLIKVYSLEVEEGKRIGTYIEETLNFSVECCALQSSDLRRRQTYELKQLQLIIHVVDGRTLLVDKDGLYNQFLCSGGNVCLALSGIETDEQTAITELVQAGQTSIEYLIKAGRFFAFNYLPCASHLDLLTRLIENATFFVATDQMRSSDDNTTPLITKVSSSARVLVQSWALPVFNHVTASFRPSQEEDDEGQRSRKRTSFSLEEEISNTIEDDDWDFCDDVIDFCQAKAATSFSSSSLQLEVEERVLQSPSLPSASVMPSKDDVAV
mmetsp:Transcript_7742/g.11717  ORF Transcript_7742/g.11717 Transcript_7742/m.11717 type:complete len:283 (+) Transcript_7742:26-874(+)